jgi:tetratricopeptide (TPR) repeat protein
MLKMTREINDTLLTKIPSRAEPRIEVGCVTCHHGRREPKTLQTMLFETIAAEGVPAAVKRYKDARNNMVSGLYDFGEWEMNELARRLVEAKKLDEAIAMLELNGEYYPKSAEIDFRIAEILLMKGDKEKALERFRKTLEKAPNYEPAKARIAELEKK